MPFCISLSPRFEKNYKKLSKTEKRQLKRKLDLFIGNPLHPSLRTKRIKGSNGLFEFSVNMDIRVIWYREDDMIIILLDVGHHDVLSNY